MIFADASALVAILTEEPDGPELRACLMRPERSVTSPLALFEAALALRRKLAVDMLRAEALLERLLVVSDTETLPVTEAEGRLALAAHERYGKGRGHPAGLNMGDCFAYAMAKSLGAALLCKGDDFIHTDIRIARSPD